MSSYIGAQFDTRSEKEKQSDYDYREVAMGEVSPKYTTRARAKKIATKYKQKDQKKTSACGAYAGTFALELDTGTTHEPAYLYRKRANFPTLGMNIHDIGKLLNEGVCEYLGIQVTEEAYNYYQPTSLQINNANKYSGTKYVFMPDNSFTVADIAHVLNELKRPIILFIYAQGTEWRKEYPDVLVNNLDPRNAGWRHFVVCIPETAYIYKGKKYFMIIDSRTDGGTQLRHLDDDFVLNRTLPAIYTLKLDKATSPLTVKYQWTRDLRVGSTGKDVQMLQTALQQLGYFPKTLNGKPFSPTTYFGGITAKAVSDFQEAYANVILKFFGLSKGTGFFGGRTRAKLNEMCK